MGPGSARGHGPGPRPGAMAGLRADTTSLSKAGVRDPDDGRPGSGGSDGAEQATRTDSEEESEPPRNSVSPSRSQRPGS